MFVKIILELLRYPIFYEYYLPTQKEKKTKGARVQKKATKQNGTPGYIPQAQKRTMASHGIVLVKFRTKCYPKPIV